MRSQRFFLSNVLAIFIFGLNVYAQTTIITPEEFLHTLPAPALDATEALGRCPAEIDTLTQSILRKLSSRANKDTLDVEAAVNKQRSLHLRLLAKLRQQLEREVQMTGEQVDKEIQACPKTADGKGELEYDATCVEEAELRGYHRRVAVVEDYLSNIHQVWPEYLAEAKRIVAEAEKGKWQVVLRVAVDVATITEMAGQFVR